MTATILSTRGQVVIPKELRDARDWHAGMVLEVEEWPQGLLIRPARPKPFPPSTLEQVMGSAGYEGPALSEDDIAKAVDAAMQQAGGTR